MNNLASLLAPALLGLVAGIGHGVTSHYLDLPVSLTEQLFPASEFIQSMELDE